MASPIVNANLSGATVTYNGVQFGGADSNYKSLPPSYQFNGRPRYDASQRVIIGVDWTLTINCIFYEESEASMASNMQAIRIALLQQGRALSIVGLGTGFGVISIPVTTTYSDLDGGPKPLNLQCNTLGQLAWELSFTLQFFISECQNPSTDQLAFKEFNFTTTWNNDFEGLATRVITGYVVIPQFRTNAAPKTMLHIADETRGNIIVNVPIGFRRVENTWSENITHDRLDFNIVDEQLKGDPLPDGVTEARGSFDTSFGDGKGGFAQGLCALNMTIKTAPNVHRNMAGKLFLAACLSKQAAIQAALPTTGDTKGTIIPLKLQISNQKFGDCRVTSCSMIWSITSCLNAMLAAADIWQPVSDMIGSTFGAPQTYTTWKASMASLWGNRGLGVVANSVDETVIINLCDNAVTKTIGTVVVTPPSQLTQALPTLTCTTVPSGGGWLNFDLQLKVLRKDEQTLHRRAASYIPQLGTLVVQDPETNDSSTLGGPSYSQSSSDEHVTEYHGYPETLIGLKFQGLRYSKKPYIPEIISVGGLTATLVKNGDGSPKWAFDSFGCPVWYIEGWRIYRVPGKISTIKSTNNRISCGAPVVATTDPVETGVF